MCLHRLVLPYRFGPSISFGPFHILLALSYPFDPFISYWSLHILWVLPCPFDPFISLWVRPLVRRVADLEITTYYTRMLPLSSPLYTKLDETYQSYLHAVQENNDHQLGPPMIHRYKAMLDYLMGEERLKAKAGLAPQNGTPEQVMQELETNPAFGDINAVVDAFGHYKMQKNT